MKKNNLFLSIAATVMLVLTTACVEYPDMYGFITAFDGSNEITVVEYTPTHYTIQLKSSTAIFDEGAGISEYGFHLERESKAYWSSEWTALSDIKVTPTKGTDGNITLTATFQGNYGERYRFCPYATDWQQVQNGTTSEFKYSQHDFSLWHASSNLSFDENGQIVAVANYGLTSGHPITEATASYGDLDLPTTITNNGSSATAVLDLSRLEKGKSYSYIQFDVKNDMGACRSYETYSVTVPNTSTASYPDDGEKEDCIRLCGIDWAKGNLANDGDKYYIKESQWKTGGSYKPNESTLYSEWMDQQMTTWMFPLPYDTRLLLEVSRFPCYVVCADGRKVYGNLYVSPKGKQIEATTSVDIDYKLVNKLGVFLPSSNDYLLSFNSCFRFTSIKSEVANKSLYFIRPVKTPTLAGKSFFMSSNDWDVTNRRYTFVDSNRCEVHEWGYYHDGWEEYEHNYSFTYKIMANRIVFEDGTTTRTLYLHKDATNNGAIFLSNDNFEHSPYTFDLKQE